MQCSAVQCSAVQCNAMQCNAMLSGVCAAFFVLCRMFVLAEDGWQGKTYTVVLYPFLYIYIQISGFQLRHHSGRKICVQLMLKLCKTSCPQHCRRRLWGPISKSATLRWHSALIIQVISLFASASVLEAVQKCGVGCGNSNADGSAMIPLLSIRMHSCCELLEVTPPGSLILSEQKNIADHAMFLWRSGYDVEIVLQETVWDTLLGRPAKHTLTRRSWLNSIKIHR